MAAGCGDEQRVYPDQSAGFAGFAGADDQSEGGGGSGARGNESGAEGGGAAGKKGDDRGDGGDGGDGVTEDLPLLLNATSLDDAHFNAPYTATFRATGGMGEHSFTVSDGELPHGLELSDDGTLSGTPLDDGDFEFTVTVSDEVDHSESLEFALRVVRKRWLAYVAVEKNTTQPLLYLTDVSSVLLHSTLLSTDLQPEGSVEYHDYRFSADGSKLAFAVDKTVDGEKELFVVDLSGSTPGKVELVDSTRGVGAFDLSPDGTGIAYQVAGEVRFVDLSDGTPDAPILISPASASSIYWLGAHRLVYGGSTVTREGTTFGEAQQFEGGGPVEAIDHASQRILFTDYEYSTCMKYNILCDFNVDLAGHHAPLTWIGTGDWTPSYNRQLSLVAFADGYDRVFVFPSYATEGEPLGIISPARTCGGSMRWSPDGASVVMPNVDARLFYSTVSNAGIKSFEVGGGYGTVATSEMEFASDDRFVFSADDRLYDFRIDESGQPVDAVALSPPLDPADYLRSVTVAPDGSWVFYVAAQETPGKLGPYAIELKNGARGEPRALAPSDGDVVDENTLYPPGTPVPDPAFSSDASRLAFVQEPDAEYGGGKDLFVADMLHPTAVANPVDCWCDRIESFLFQP